MPIASKINQNTGGHKSAFVDRVARIKRSVRGQGIY